MKTPVLIRIEVHSSTRAAHPSRVSSRPTHRLADRLSNEDEPRRRLRARRARRVPSRLRVRPKAFEGTASRVSRRRAVSVTAGAPMKTVDEAKELLDRQGYKMLDIRPFKAYDREHLTKPPSAPSTAPSPTATIPPRSPPSAKAWACVPAPSFSSPISTATPSRLPPTPSSPPATWTSWPSRAATTAGAESLPRAEGADRPRAMDQHRRRRRVSSNQGSPSIPTSPPRTRKTGARNPRSTASAANPSRRGRRATRRALPSRAVAFRPRRPSRPRDGRGDQQEARGGAQRARPRDEQGALGRRGGERVGHVLRREQQAALSQQGDGAHTTWEEPNRWWSGGRWVDRK